MCAFRMGAVSTPYGKSYSSDEGRTWTAPVAIPGALSVQPSLAVMKDGMVVLSGGRPGVSLWFNLDGRGEEWQRAAIVPEEAAKATDISWKEIMVHNRGDVVRTTSYTEVLALDERNVLVIYDYIPCGWAPVPPDSTEANSIWVLRATVSRK
jgi:hypothetical protein